MKRTGKIILKVVGWTVTAALLFVAGVCIYDLIKGKAERRALVERGYENPVSVGDHSLNVYRAGNEDGEHTFVTLSGWSDGEAYIGWRPMTSAFENDYEFIFIDRQRRLGGLLANLQTLHRHRPVRRRDRDRS